MCAALASRAFGAQVAIDAECSVFHRAVDAAALGWIADLVGTDWLAEFHTQSKRRKRQARGCMRYERDAGGQGVIVPPRSREGLAL